MPSQAGAPATKRPAETDLDGDIDHHHHNHHHNHNHSLGITSNKASRADDDDGGAASASQHQTSTKKKSAGSSRTGQACDRCKIRKIRCDARPGGCSPCLQNNSDCKTTDRITGRATNRGHTELVENENRQLKVYMIELQQQLRDNGIEPNPPPAVPAGYSSAFAGSTHYPMLPSHAWDSRPSNSNGSTLLASSRQVHDRQGSQSSPLPNFRPGCIGDNYLGVSSENNWLSTIEGTSLTLFGTKIDLAEFMPPDSDPTNAATSYRTFLNHAFGRTKPFAPPLPPYEQCKVYADWFFRSVQMFLPILHKPDHMKLIDRIYNDNYQPSPAELVMVHMVLAIINFQFSARNANQQAWSDSMDHYHYALSFIPDLVTGHKLEDIQALILITSQLRSHPRPGAAWMFTNMVMGLVVESGLHRSAKAWQGSSMNQEPHHLEMRKRLFWSILAFHVHISGKLGRPMPLRVEDFDIEIPEPMPDNVPGEAPTTKWRKCSWRAGYSGFKLLRIMMQVYSSIYSIKSTGQYEMNVRTLEKELDDFNESIPPELQGGSQTKDEDRVAALYLDFSVAECQLLLHHPSLCRSPNPEISRSNLDICSLWSNKMLDTAAQLKDLKSLDTTWYSWTDFLAAIFTTLFVSTQRRDQMTSEDLQNLRRDMDRWLDVMGEASTLLGASHNLQSQVQHLVEFSIGNISRHVAAKTASAAVASTVSPTNADAPPAIYDSQGSNHYYANGTTNGQSYLDSSQSQQQTQQPYSSGNPFTYPPAQDSDIATYMHGTVSNYGTAYATAETKPNGDTQLVTSMSKQDPASSNFTVAFHANQQEHSGYPQNIANQNGYPQSGPAAWRTFTDSMMTNVNGQEYMHSAGTLMRLGNKPDDGSMDMAAVGMAHLHAQSAHGNQHWPLIAYNDANHRGEHG